MEQLMRRLQAQLLSQLSRQHQQAAAAVQRSTQPVPKAPTSQSSAMSSDPAAAPKTPVKAQADASKPYPFQFGSISPGFMNGMQVPARTSSAPPNLGEQKRDQARHDSFRPPPPLPIPTAPKQQFPRKDAVAAEQSNTGEAHSGPKVKKYVQILPAPPASQPQKPPVLPPMGGMSMPMQYHQPQVSVQFAGPNQQLQSEGMTAAPLQMQLPMSLSYFWSIPPLSLSYFWLIPPLSLSYIWLMGLSMAYPPQVQLPMFLQPHPMQQGIIHQSQYTAQMGPQLPPQLGNMGMGMTPPYSQQQGGKIGGPCKTTVKITHPDTHEELRLDKQADSYSDGGSSAPRSFPNMPPQSQPIPSFGPSHPLNFYNPNSFNAGSMFYPPQSSHGVEKSEPTKHVRPSGEVSSSHPQREVTESLASKSLPVATKQSVVVSAAVSSEGLVLNPSSSASVSPSKESVPVVPINEGRQRETLSRSNSIKDYQKKIGKKGLIQSQHQVGSQSASISSLPSRALEQGISSSSGVFGTVEAKTTVATPTPVTSEGVSSTQQSPSNVSGGTPDASELKSDTVVEASYSVSSEISGARIIVDKLETVHQAKLDKSSSQDEELVNETVGKDEQGENSLPAGSTQVINSSEISSEPISLKSSEFNKEVKQSGHDSGLKVVSDEVLTIETAQKRLDEPVSHHAEIDGTTDNLEILNSTDLGSSDVGSSHGEKSSTVDASSSRSDSIGSNEIGTMSGTSDQLSAPIPAPDLKEATSKPILDQNKAKVTSKATKKKKKKILLKVDAAGTTSDLYNAYKAHHDSFRPPHPLPIPTAPKQQFLRKDAVDAEQTNTGEAHSVPKVKKDVQVSPVPPASQPQKPPVLPPMGGMWPMQYHQPQVSVQFAGPNQQLQSQGMTATPLQMQLPMGLSMANAPQVQPPMFLQPHPMQQGIIHQLGNMGMGPQLPPQLGNMGMGMTPPYPQQQGGKFGGPRKTTVKITHPDTHEELRALRLDKWADSYSDGGSSAPRSLPNIPPQSQPIPSFAPSHPLNFYIPNSFNAGSMFYPPQSSVPLTSSQLAPNSQAPRFNYPVGQNPQNMAYMNPSALNSLPVNKTGTPMHVTVDLPKHEGEDAEIIGGGLAPLPASGAKDKPILDQNKAKVTSKATKKKGKEIPSKEKKEKKKRKEILLKADATGTASDLYNAYKGPEEKKDTILSTDYTESISTCVNEKQAPADAVEVDAVASEMGGLNKAEPDDWEDAADLSTPKLEVSDDGQLIHGGLDHYDHDGDGSMAKKYSRDFLLNFSEQCTDLPEDFEITSHIEALLRANLNLFHLVERDSYPSPGRIVDRLSAKKKGKEIPSKKRKEKKKRKEICLKADAAGTTSDLYNAYKGPKEKKDTILSTDYTESISTCVNEKQAPVDAVQVDAVASEMGGLNKAEPDDWEDAADLSTPKLEVSDDGQLIHGGLG